MNDKEYEEMMNAVKNQMFAIGHEVTASDSMLLALKIGRVVYFDDTFGHATLDQIMGAFTNFISSYIHSRPDFSKYTHDQKRIYIHEFMNRLSLLFTVTEIAADEIRKNQAIQKGKCDHLGSLVDYALNEGYWYCTKCKDKIKKHVRKE